MPDGGEHIKVGACPYCASRRIRLRRDVRPYRPWRCRSCNKVFSTPKIGTTTSHSRARRRGYVLAQRIPHLERHARRAKRRLRIQKLKKALAVVAVVLGVLAVVTVQQGMLAPLSSLAQGEKPSMQVEKVPPPTVSLAPTPVSELQGRLRGTEQVFSTPAGVDGSVRVSTPSHNFTLLTSPVSGPTMELVSSPAPTLEPHLRYFEAKSYMLELINKERVSAGVPPVELGDNWAAQLHAESALANCFSSHWGIDGLAPYMRYSLAGGYQANGENGSGLGYCFNEEDRVTALKPTKRQMTASIEGFMSSPGHRGNILDKHHRKVNIGIALEDYNLFVYQHFEGDYVEYEVMPNISDNGVLTLIGTTKNDAEFDQGVGVTVFYDPPPHGLTRGQLSRTYCYNNGL